MPAAPVARRSGLAFTIVVSVVMFVGACVMALVLLMSSAPGALVVGVVLAAGPVAPLIACFVWLDRYEPEPRSLLLLGLGWGAFVATSSALLLQIAGEFAFEAPRTFSGAVVAPLTEEAAKGLFILLLLWFRRHELDGILDGIVYAGMVGIGFAFTENILYLSAADLGSDGQSGGVGGAIMLFVIRGVFSPFAHPLFTAFTGIGIGIAVGSRKPAVRFFAPLAGYLFAVGAHAAWNGSTLPGRRRGLRAHLPVRDGPRVLPGRRVRDLGASPGVDSAHRGAHRLREARVHRPGRDPVAGPAARAPGGTPLRRSGRRSRGALDDGGVPAAGDRARLPAQPFPPRYGAATTSRSAGSTSSTR